MPTKYCSMVFAGILAAFLMSGCSSTAVTEAPAGPPDLDGGTAWLNTAGPVKLADLRGKIVLLDFWTFCCINCIHTLPDLAKLEAKYEKELVVVGVHSAKFENEKNTDAIRKAVLRYQVKHPVVNDSEMKIWNRFGINGWPTLVLVDPEGKILDQMSGEGHFDALDRTIKAMIDEHTKKGTLDLKPRRFDLARFREKDDTPLFFPGKVFADAAGNRLVISDSTHHRVVITDLSGKHIATAGTGEPGFVDGPFASARFDDPQGLAIDGDTVYVADRKNHSIRALDLKAGTVRTNAGTGVQNRSFRGGGGPATKTGLNSPWDLLLVNQTLYVAMAGHHQIWAMDLKTDQVSPFAGNNDEAIVDGARLEGCLAQPSGLATDGKQLFVADSESSAIRAIDLGPSGKVMTLVGMPGQGLFQFGDIDGAGEKVRLQHPLGVVYHDNVLYVADTYNSKLKAIDPKRGTCTTWVGGSVNGAKPFNEPAGLSIANGKLYVADTNAHRIQVVDLKSKAISTLALSGVTPPAAQGSAR